MFYWIHNLSFLVFFVCVCEYFTIEIIKNSKLFFVVILRCVRSAGCCLCKLVVCARRLIFYLIKFTFFYDKKKLCLIDGFHIFLSYKEWGILPICNVHSGLLRCVHGSIPWMISEIISMFRKIGFEMIHGMIYIDDF